MYIMINQGRLLPLSMSLHHECSYSIISLPHRAKTWIFIKYLPSKFHRIPSVTTVTTKFFFCLVNLHFSRSICIWPLRAFSRRLVRRSHLVQVLQRLHDLDIEQRPTWWFLRWVHIKIHDRLNMQCLYDIYDVYIYIHTWTVNCNMCNYISLYAGCVVHIFRLCVCN